MAIHVYAIADVYVARTILLAAVLVRAKDHAAIFCNSDGGAEWNRLPGFFDHIGDSSFLWELSCFVNS